mgnify:CR=1 FL=1
MSGAAVKEVGAVVLEVEAVALEVGAVLDWIVRCESCDSC